MSDCRKITHVHVIVNTYDNKPLFEEITEAFNVETLDNVLTIKTEYGYKSFPLLHVLTDFKFIKKEL